MRLYKHLFKQNVFFSGACPLCNARLIERHLRPVFLSHSINRCRAVQNKKGATSEASCADATISNETIDNVAEISKEIQPNELRELNDTDTKSEASCADATIPSETIGNVANISEENQPNELREINDNDADSVTADDAVHGEIETGDMASDDDDSVDEGSNDKGDGTANPYENVQFSIVFDLGQHNAEEEEEEEEVPFPTEYMSDSDDEDEKEPPRRSKRKAKPVQKFSYGYVRCCVCFKNYVDYDSAFATSENTVCSLACLFGADDM